MRAFFLTTLRQLALAAAAILVTGSALAHSSSNSYLTLSAPAQQLMLRADINLRDLDLIFDLDENRTAASPGVKLRPAAASLTPGCARASP